MQEVKIIEDSVSPSGVRLTTFQLKYQRFIHSEFMTHRVFSRNASSSRAIPVKTILSQVWNDPASPHEWGKNKAGMQSRENLSGWRLKLSKFAWKMAAKAACGIAYGMMKVGLHKQVANRILEPFQWIHVVLTATEFENFFALRNHPDAQPEIRDLAKQMQEVYRGSQPRQLAVGEWHLPYISLDERKIYDIETSKKMSAARCARVSYVKHDGTASKPSEDVELFSQLVVRPYTDKRGNVLTAEDPPHMSPVEHQAICTSSKGFYGNFKQWKQFRKFLEK